MTTRNFFALSLFLPLLGGVIGLLVPALGILVVALLFGGLPYVIFAPVLALRIRRVTSMRRLVTLALLSPIVFVPFVVGLVALVGSTSATRELPFQDEVQQLVPVAIYALGVSYGYVFLAWGLWLVARKTGAVQNELAT